MMKKLMAKMNEKYLGYVRNEKGAQALEWVALGLVVIAMGIQGSSIGETIISKLEEMIQGIGS
jgi:Flp pilus assembly pilin Flp